MRFLYHYVGFYRLYMSLLGNDEGSKRSIRKSREARNQILNVRLYFFFICQMLVMQTLVFLAGFIKKYVTGSAAMDRIYDLIYTSMILISYNLFYIGISNSIYRTTTD